MNAQNIISHMNTFLYESARALEAWLNVILPRITDSWWDECVLPSLSYTQQEIAKSNGFSKLEDFDLAALLRIAKKSWFEMQSVAYLPTKEREVVTDMIIVRNHWAHCGTVLPGKDTILRDLRTICRFLDQIGGDAAVKQELYRFINEMERPDSVPEISEVSPHLHIPTAQHPADKISVGSMVCLLSRPETKGVVLTCTKVGDVKQYTVFVNNTVQSFLADQIQLYTEHTERNWVDIQTVRSYLTAYQLNHPSSNNLYSLNAARIDFVPYQFRPALKLIHADEPRLLIADSVGVGKTIEAGLIVKELEARSELQRVVVICPRPLVAERKWELEMKRFDEDFVPVDGPMLRQILSDTDRDGEWPTRFSRVIIPYSILDSRAYQGESGRRRRTIGLSKLDPEPHFDLVIVDEAHHIRNGSMDKEKAFAYKCTKYFCDHADAVVMLTATPLQTGDHDLYTLLNVLRPDLVIDTKTFEMMAMPNSALFRAVHVIRTAQEDWAKQARTALLDVRKTQWGDNVIAENPLYHDILRRLESGVLSREERVTLINDIESLHSFHGILNRTRRRDIQDFCVRRPHTVAVTFTNTQQHLHDELLSFERFALSILHDARTVPFLMSTLQRQAASCIFGLAPFIQDIIERRIQQINDDPEMDYSLFDWSGSGGDVISEKARQLLVLAEHLPEEDPKFDATWQVIQAKQGYENNKIMLFSTFRHTLAYLKRRLSALGCRVEQIDGSVKDEVRYRMKERFELPKDNPDAIDILLFTEVGSEGLDYQFCDMMINYDLPWNPMRIEQRIGRIDRRGQMSEAVNIYNIITDGTVDAEIYYRCLWRIGIFEQSIGDCEGILGEIASGIETIALNTTLTESERLAKLEQMADNEVRKLQELNRLEEEERELFGFDLSEYTTTQEIRRAENPWLTQRCLQSMIEHYLKERSGVDTCFFGEAERKNLRLSASVRSMLREDLRSLPGSRNTLRRKWEAYLTGNKPNHSVTFDPDTARAQPDCDFLTAVHPLSKQAAAYFVQSDKAYLRFTCRTEEIPAGEYLFSVYGWQYEGFQARTRLVTICENELVEKELPILLEETEGETHSAEGSYDWSELEHKHVERWSAARKAHKQDVDLTITYKLESLSNTYRNRIRMLEQQSVDALDEQIRKMRLGELKDVKEQYAAKAAKVREMANRADVYATLLVNGVVSVMEG